MTLTQVSGFPQHDGLFALSSFNGWSLFQQGQETISGLFYNASGELVRVFKENNVLFIMAIGSFTGAVILHVFTPIVASTALSIGGTGASYFYSGMKQIIPVTKAQMTPIMMQGYTMLPSSGWLWSTGAAAGTAVMTTAKKYPAAVLTAAAAYYFKDDIKQYGAGLVGLLVIGIGAAVYLESSNRTSIKRKLNIQ